MKRQNRKAQAVRAGFILALGILFLGGAQVHATTVSLAPVAKQQFLSATGAPLAAGCVYTYAGGTTTFLASFVDSTGTTQNTDPIQLDSGGFANIWLTGSAYKFAVYSNPTGGACPGTPGGSLVLQYTVDNITTSTGSGSGAATSVVSAGANPASSGIIEMTKTDTICWRNVANSGNTCLSKDSNDLLTWSQGSLNLPEVGTPAGTGAANDTLWADSTAHRFKMSNNGAAADVFAGAATTDTFTNKTFDTGGAGNVFKIAGTQITAITGTGNAALNVSPSLFAPNIGGSCSNTANVIAGLGNGTLCVGDGSAQHTLVDLSLAQTLTNKTLTSPAISSPTLSGTVAGGATYTSPKIGTGIPNNGTGLQHLRIAACASATPCNGTITWNSTWADTNYTVVCTVENSGGAQQAFVGIIAKTTTTTTYQMGSTSTIGTGNSLDCIGIHD